MTIQSDSQATTGFHLPFLSRARHPCCHNQRWLRPYPPAVLSCPPLNTPPPIPTLPSISPQLAKWTHHPTPRVGTHRMSPPPSATRYYKAMTSTLPSCTFIPFPSPPIPTSISSFLFPFLSHHQHSHGQLWPECFTSFHFPFLSRASRPNQHPIIARQVDPQPDIAP